MHQDELEMLASDLRRIEIELCCALQKVQHIRTVMARGSEHYNFKAEEITEPIR